MRKTIRRIIPVNDAERMREIRRKARASSQEGMPHERECSAERIVGNQHLVFMLLEKLKTEGRDATVALLDSLGCSGKDIQKLLDKFLCDR